MTNNNNQFGYDISIVDYSNEKWIRVQAMGEDFIIAPYDLTDADNKVMTDSTQPELMKRLNELHLDTFNRKQGFIIAMLIEEINAKLEEAGGNKFDEDWYVSKELWKPVGRSADSYGNNAWCIFGTYGSFGFSYRYTDYFRARPVINYKESEKTHEYWKPSDEQMRPLRYAIDYFKKKKNDTTYLESLYDDLKKL